MCEKMESCSCRIAVTRTYRELKERYIPDIMAFDTAAKIYRLHHPEVPELEVRLSINKWLDQLFETRSPPFASTGM